MGLSAVFYHLQSHLELGFRVDIITTTNKQ